MVKLFVITKGNGTNMYKEMHEIGDTFPTTTLGEHIKHLITWRRKTNNQAIIDAINKELIKCYNKKYKGL